MAIEIEYIGTSHEEKTAPEPTYHYVLKMGVKGARRVIEETYGSLEEARKRAERWTASNGQGSYYTVIDEIKVWPSGSMVTYRERRN